MQCKSKHQTTARCKNIFMNIYFYIRDNSVWCDCNCWDCEACCSSCTIEDQQKMIKDHKGTTL